MGTGDDPRESTTGFMLVLGDRIEDAGMIGAKIDEAVCDSSLAMIRNKEFLAKQDIRTSHRASKKADEAVYFL